MSKLQSTAPDDDRPTSPKELCETHNRELHEMAERDDKVGAIARGILKAGGELVDE